MNSAREMTVTLSFPDLKEAEIPEQPASLRAQYNSSTWAALTEWQVIQVENSTFVKLVHISLFNFHCVKPLERIDLAVICHIARVQI